MEADRTQLDDPATRGRAKAARLDHYLPRLETLLSTARDLALARPGYA